MAVDLEIDIQQIVPWFAISKTAPFVQICVAKNYADQWPEALRDAVRKCYLTDQLAQERSIAEKIPAATVVASKFPDPGHIMAGDFGEILIFLLQAALEVPNQTIGPKKWRLKVGRNTPAPFSDVVQFVLPSWPKATTEDRLLCAEVKFKSTPGVGSPIEQAIAGCEKDRTSRLAKTLVWLRERAIGEPLGSVQIHHLERFINASDHPVAQKIFRAVAVVCSTLIQEELKKAPVEQPLEYEVIVVEIPDLHSVYNAVYASANSWPGANPGIQQ